MNTQVEDTPAGILSSLPAGRVLPLGSAGGRLEVLHGRVWLTRAGDLDDHVVAGGQTFSVPASGHAVVEAWGDLEPALVAWHPGRFIDRLGAALRAAFVRCWDIVDPARRVGAGSLAAAVALVSGALLFGPLSDARTRTLAAPLLLHDHPAQGARPDGVGQATRGSLTDAGAGNRGRARIAAQEARRRAPGAA